MKHIYILLFCVMLVTACVGDAPEIAISHTPHEEPAYPSFFLLLRSTVDYENNRVIPEDIFRATLRAWKRAATDVPETSIANVIIVDCDDRWFVGIFPIGNGKVVISDPRRNYAPREGRSHFLNPNCGVYLWKGTLEVAPPPIKPFVAMPAIDSSKLNERAPGNGAIYGVNTGNDGKK